MQTAMNQPRHCVTISPIIGVERWPSARNIDRLFDGIKLGWTVDGQRSAVPGSERCCPQQPPRPHCVYLLRLAMSTHVAASLAVASADWLRQRTMITLVVLRRPLEGFKFPCCPLTVPCGNCSFSCLALNTAFCFCFCSLFNVFCI